MVKTLSSNFLVYFNAGTPPTDEEKAALTLEIKSSRDPVIQYPMLTMLELYIENPHKNPIKFSTKESKKFSLGSKNFKDCKILLFRKKTSKKYSFTDAGESEERVAQMIEQIHSSFELYLHTCTNEGLSFRIQYTY